MSTVRFAELESGRVELHDAQLTWETRCDACGEFVEASECVSVDYRLIVGRIPATQNMIDLHRACVPRLDWPGIIAAHLERIS